MDPYIESIQLLQQALVMEYEDIVLYLREAALFKEKLVNGVVLGELFSRYCDNEIWHADQVAAELLRQGEKPDWDFHLFAPTNSLRKTLTVHRARENKICEIYRRIIALKVTSPGFQKTVQSIYTEEQAHIDKIEFLLKALNRNVSDKSAQP